MSNDLIADLLTRIRNAQLRSRDEVFIPLTKSNSAVLKILKDNSYIEDFKEVDSDADSFKKLLVTLKYDEDKPAITKLIRVSKPGLRKYIGYKNIPKVLNGMGISIISTPKGIMTGDKARAEKAGGEYLCNIW